MPHFLINNILRKNSKEIEITNPFEDDRSEAASILANLYREWQEEWQKTKEKAGLRDTAELRYFENDQKDAVLSQMAKILCDFEYDNGDNFEEDLKNLATELYPSILPEKREFNQFLGKTLKHYISTLISLEEGRLKLEEPNLTEDVARRILTSELGITNSNFIETSLLEDFSGQDFENFVKSEIIELNR